GSCTRHCRGCQDHDSAPSGDQDKAASHSSQGRLMADIISPERRSALMSRIRGKDTKIELEVRKGLHALGLRYRLGGAGLPGRPDIVLSKHRTVVLVHGCFWHKHDCELFRMP